MILALLTQESAFLTNIFNRMARSYNMGTAVVMVITCYRVRASPEIVGAAQEVLLKYEQLARL